MARSSPGSPTPPLALLALLLAFGACGGRQQQRDRWIDEIKVHGVEALDADDLLAGLGSQATPWYWWVPLVGDGRSWFDPAVLDADVQRVVGFYTARGFFSARVTRREVRPVAGGRGVAIELTVDEGRPATVSGVRLDGLVEIPASIRRRIASGLPVKVGQRFDADRYERAKAAVPDELKNAGYPYAAVEGRVAVHRKDRTAHVELSAKPGPRFRFGQTRFAGQGPIPEDKLRPLVRWNAGDVYDPQAIERTREKLFALRVFSSVRIEIPDRPTERAPVTIKLSPTKLRELRLGVGIGFEQQRHEVRLSGRWTWRNFLGGLRTLTAEVKPSWVAIPALWDAERSGPAVDTELRLVQPDLLGSRITVFGAIGYEVNVEAGYRYHGPRTQIGGERFFFDEILRLGASWNLQFLDFFDIDDRAFDRTATPLGLGFTDSYRLSWLEESIQLDLRDAPVDARAGFYAAVRFEQGLRATGGEFDYLKLTPEARGYIPLGTRRLVLALRGQFGYMLPASGEDTPITRRYNLGGPTDHRGFGFHRLSTQVYDDKSGRWIPLGGNTALLLSADLRLRLRRIAGNWLNLVGFFDAGDVVPRPGDLRLDLLHLAVGSSLLYQTPIGAIRFAWGVRLNRIGCVVADTGAPLPEALASQGCAFGAPMNPDPGSRWPGTFHLTIGEAF